MRKRNAYMCGGKNWVTAMSWPQVMLDVQVTRSASEKTVSERADGLKMCARRPFLCQRINALAVNPTASIMNCRKNQSGLNHRNRFVLKTIGNGPNPRVNRSPRDHVNSASNAYANNNWATM